MPVTVRMSPCRLKRIVSVARSLANPRWRLMSPSLKCVVTVVSVSPSHVPVVKPPCGCGAYCDGCGRPSIQIMVTSRSPQPAIFHASSFCVTGSCSIEICSGNGPVKRVERRIHLTLPLGGRERRDVVAQRLRAAVRVQRHPEEVDGLDRVDVVRLPAAGPRAGEIDLGERGDRRQNDECDQRGDSHIDYHCDEHGVGSHLAPFGSFLKIGATSLAVRRYCGSSTCVVIVSHSSPFGRL